MAVIVGIGLNIHTREFPDDLQQSATSLWLSSLHDWTRLEMFAAIMKKWHTLYPDYLKTLRPTSLDRDTTAPIAEEPEWLQL